jgi:hypothetical protein
MLAVALAAISGCHDMTGPGSIPAGGYAYTGFASNGAVIVTGWLTLDLANPAQVTGTWHLDPVGNPQNIGPQTGDGHLLGGMSGGVLNVNLNPDSADSNVFLNGPVGGNSFSGRWTYSGFVGVVNEGSFQALQR